MKEKLKKILISTTIFIFFIVCLSSLYKITQRPKYVNIEDILNIEECLDKYAEIADKEIDEKEYEKFIKKLKKENNLVIDNKETEIVKGTLAVKQYNNLQFDKVYKFSNNKLQYYEEHVFFGGPECLEFEQKAVKKKYENLEKQLISKYGTPEKKEIDKDGKIEAIYYWTNEKIEISVPDDETENRISVYIRIYK